MNKLETKPPSGIDLHHQALAGTLLLLLLHDKVASNTHDGDDKDDNEEDLSATSGGLGKKFCDGLATVFVHSVDSRDEFHSGFALVGGVHVEFFAELVELVRAIVVEGIAVVCLARIIVHQTTVLVRHLDANQIFERDLGFVFRAAVLIGEESHADIAIIGTGRSHKVLDILAVFVVVFDIDFTALTEFTKVVGFLVVDLSVVVLVVVELVKEVADVFLETDNVVTVSFLADLTVFAGSSSGAHAVHNSVVVGFTLLVHDLHVGDALQEDLFVVLQEGGLIVLLGLVIAVLFQLTGRGDGGKEGGKGELHVGNYGGSVEMFKTKKLCC